MNCLPLGGDRAPGPPSWMPQQLALSSDTREGAALPPPRPPSPGPAPHLPLHAETPGIVDDALAHPIDGLGGSIWGVAEDGQGWGMDGGFDNTIDS